MAGDIRTLSQRLWKYDYGPRDSDRSTRIVLIIAFLSFNITTFDMSVLNVATRADVTND